MNFARRFVMNPRPSLPYRATVFTAAPALLAGVLAVALPEYFLHAYFVAYVACLSCALGAMGILLIYGLSGGAWEHWLSPPMRASLLTLPLFALASVPLALGLEVLFPWVNADAASTELKGHQAIWLQTHWHLLRLAGYFLVWFVVLAGLNVWPLSKPLRMTHLRSALALLAWVLTSSFFAIDWIMTLITEAGSTMVGLLHISDQLTAALALGALWVCVHHSRRPAESPGDDRRRAGVRNDIGNLLLAAVMFHAYCLFMDYLVVWEGNLPHEIAWYLEREDFFTGPLGTAIPICYIALPIVALLFRRVKYSRVGLGSIAAMVLTGHVLLVAWYLLPARAEHIDRQLLYKVVDWAWALTLIGLWAWLTAHIAILIDRRQYPTEQADEQPN